jgi:hypothetical protein
MPETDKLSAALDGMRRRARQITDEHGPDDCDLNGETCTGHDAEQLLDALDAVLKLAHGWEAEASRLDAMAEDAADSARSAHLFVRAQGRADSAAALLGVITTGLLGEDGH